MTVRQGVRNPYLTSSLRSHGANAEQLSDRQTAATTSSTLIDNSRNIYVRIRFRCGGIVMCRPEVFWKCPAVLQVLYEDMCNILALLPSSLRPLLRRTKIWVNHEYAYGSKHKPIEVTHSTAHYHHEWLLWYVLPRSFEIFHVLLFEKCFSPSRSLTISFFL